MAVMYELPKSREFTIDASTSSITTEWFLSGLSDEGTVRAFAVAKTPRIFRRLIRSSIRAQPVGKQEWYVTIEYGTLTGVNPDSTGAGGQGGAPINLSPSFGFDTGGATANVMQSVRTISQTTPFGVTLGTRANKFTLDNQRAIGVSKDGVAGCDKILPTFQWQYDQRLVKVPGSYLITLASLTGTVCSTKFFGFGRREVLYLGASGRATWEDGWTITHKFLVAPTRKNVRISDAIVVDEVRGHDYLWVGYGPKQVGQWVLQVPIAAYVEQIYEEGDFWLIGIGGVSERDRLRATREATEQRDDGVKVRVPKRPNVGKPSDPPIEGDAVLGGGILVPAALSQDIFQ